MNYYEIKKLINSGVNIRDIPLRVTYYARVSTDNSLQLNSLDNQINYYENLIKNNQKWIFHPGYIDEGISGSSVKNRHNFLRMIRDAKLGLFDLIITKEVSRFSRSLLDSIKYTQELNRYNVGIFFETNGINTFDSNSEFLLNMMGSVAQEEVKRLSSRIKWGQINAIKQGHILGSKITGFYKEKNKLIINPNETKLIKTIFSLYASGKYGLTTLSIKLASLGYLNSKGNLYDKNTLKGIITNPKYKGYYCGHKTEIIDYKTKKESMLHQKIKLFMQQITYLK